MSYTEVMTVVEGAVDEDECFTDRDRLARFLHKVEKAAKEDGQKTEVYLLQHDHPLDWEGECTCAQYLQDHHPNYVWP